MCNSPQLSFYVKAKYYYSSLYNLLDMKNVFATPCQYQNQPSPAMAPIFRCMTQNNEQQLSKKRIINFMSSPKK